ncbi:MAG: hypothetical protein H7333_11150 [Bdellovibrionales bacterium]|nr:hypothetical protein [Oligoflexia bacterium]
MPVIIYLALACATAKADCISLAHAHQSYQDAQPEKARAEVKCLLAKNPNSTDLYRFLSDLEKWEGRRKESLQAAKSGLATISPSVSAFDDNRIHLNDRLHQNKLRISGSILTADHNDGRNYSLELDQSLLNQAHLLLGIYHISRIYSEAKVSDTHLEASYIFAGFGKTYWENGLSYSPDAKFSAKIAGASTPHLILPHDLDLYVGVKLSHYETEVSSSRNLFTLSPGFSLPLTNWAILSVQLNEVRSFHWVSSQQAAMTLLYAQRIALRIGAAGGYAVEGPALEGSFHNYTVDLQARLTSRLTLIPRASLYEGSVRNENAFGLSAEWRF